MEDKYYNKVRALARFRAINYLISKNPKKYELNHVDLGTAYQIMLSDDTGLVHDFRLSKALCREIMRKVRLSKEV